MEAESSINKLLGAVDNRLFPEEAMKEIKGFIYSCKYADALSLITKYPDPFEFTEAPLLVDSWRTLSRYHQLMVQQYKEEYQLYCADGQGGILSCGTKIHLKDARNSMGLCREGMKKALRIEAARREQAGSRIQLTDSLKAKSH